MSTSRQRAPAVVCTGSSSPRRRLGSSSRSTPSASYPQVSFNLYWRILIMNLLANVLTNCLRKGVARPITSSIVSPTGFIMFLLAFLSSASCFIARTVCLGVVADLIYSPTEVLYSSDPVQYSTVL